jgi:hypothetical protein
MMSLGFCGPNKYVRNAFYCRSDFTSIEPYASYFLANEIAFLVTSQLKEMKVIYLTPRIQIHCVTLSIA